MNVGYALAVGSACVGLGLTVYILAAYGFPLTALTLPVFVAAVAHWAYREGRRSRGRYTRR